MAFLHHNIGDSRLIVFLQFDTRISDGQELVVENLHTEIVYKENADITLLGTTKNKSTFAVVGQSNSVVATFYFQLPQPFLLVATVLQELHLCRK